MPTTSGPLFGDFDKTTGACLAVGTIGLDDKLPLLPLTKVAPMSLNSFKIHRCFSADYSIVNNATTPTTFAQIHNLPGKFEAIRLHYPHVGGGGVVTGLKAVIAATDNPGSRTNTNNPAGRTYVAPQRLGVERNVLAADGWQAVTWGGQPTVNVADSGGRPINIVSSDWIECHGIEDPANPGWFPLLIRCFPGTAFFSRSSYNGKANVSAMLADQGPNAFQGLQFTAGDAVGTLASLNNATTGLSFGDGSILPFIIEAYTSTPRASVMVSGDSRLANASPSLLATNEYRSASFTMEQTLISRGYKMQLVKCAEGGKNTADYLQRSNAYLAKISPSVSVYLGYSINDGQPTADLLASAKMRVLMHLEACRAQSIPMVLVSIYPNGPSGYSTSMAAVNEFDDWCKNLGLPMISPLKLYGDATGNWLPGYSEDNSHMTPAGNVDMGVRMADLVTPYIF